MATSAPRTPRPWVALAVVVAAVAAILVVLRLLGDTSTGGDVPGTTDAPLATPTPDPPMALQPLTEPGQRAQPIPGLAERREALEAARRQAADDPVLVYGRVVDPDERPLPDIDVTLFDDVGDFLDIGTTDAKGEFAFSWDEALPAGWAVATDPDLLADPDDPSSVGPALHVHDTAVVPGDTPVRVELVVGRAPRLTGLVVDDATNEPIDMASVEVVIVAEAYLEEYQDDFTEEDGRFEMSLVDLPSRGILVRVADDEGRVALQGPFDMGPGETRHLEFRMQDSISLEGFVYAAATGVPLEDVEVTLLPVHPSFDASDAWDITGDDGSFLLDPVEAPLAMLVIHAFAPEHGPAVIRVGDPDRPLDIRLGDYVTIKGRIVSAATDEPVADADVLFVLRGPWGLVRDYEDSTFGDDEGRFELLLESVPPEAAEVMIEAPGFVRFRAHLADLVPTDRHWREYTLDVRMQPDTRD